MLKKQKSFSYLKMEKLFAFFIYHHFSSVKKMLYIPTQIDLLSENALY